MRLRHLLKETNFTSIRRNLKSVNRHAGNVSQSTEAIAIGCNAGLDAQAVVMAVNHRIETELPTETLHAVIGYRTQKRLLQNQFTLPKLSPNHLEHIVLCGTTLIISVEIQVE
jgi:hypothetical protein